MNKQLTEQTKEHPVNQQLTIQWLLTRHRERADQDKSFILGLDVLIYKEDLRELFSPMGYFLSAKFCGHSLGARRGSGQRWCSSE